MSIPAVQPRFLYSGAYVGQWFVTGMRLDRQSGNTDFSSAAKSSLKCRLAVSNSGDNATALVELSEADLFVEPTWTSCDVHCLFLVPSSVTEGLENVEQVIFAEFLITPVDGFEQRITTEIILYPAIVEIPIAPPGVGGSGVLVPEAVTADQLGLGDWFWAFSDGGGGDPRPRSMSYAEFITLVQLNSATEQLLSSEIDSSGVIGQPVYQKANGSVDLAIGSDLTLSSVVGVLVADVSAGFGASYKERGTITRSDWTPVTGAVGLTTGSEYFLSTVNPGQMLANPPPAGGGILIKVGYAKTANTLAVQIGQKIRR